MFVGDVPADTEAAVRAEFDAMLRRFRELGAGTADYTLYVGPGREALADIYARVAGRPPPERLCSWYPSQGAALLNLDCFGTPPYSLDGFHLAAVRERLAPAASLPSVPSGFDQRGPTWLQQGVTRYMRHWYRVERGYEDLDASRNRESSGAGRTARLLSTSSTAAGFHEEYWPSGSLAFLALEWLAEHAGQPAIFEYYRLLLASETWEEAFERAFSIGTDDFYEAFEAHRAAVAPPFPHLVDDREEPVLVFVGDVPAATGAAVQAELDAIEAWFRERFSTGAADYTLFIGADASALVDAHRRVIGIEVSEQFCYWAPYGGGGIINLDCFKDAPYGLDTAHILGVREEVSPSSSVPATPQGFDRRGPVWLIRGSETYVRHACRVARGHEELEFSRGSAASLAARTTQSLSTISTLARYNDYYSASQALSFLALEWLAEQAGDPALFEYYRRLPASSTWEEAFESAFGLTIDEFYEAFEVYRARVVSEELSNVSKAATITTVLQPGWNMVGWLSGDVPASDLFEQIPALTGVSAWDVEAGRYQRRTRTSVGLHGLRSLAPGRGLWLLIGGDDLVEWKRPASEDSMVLELHAGRNLVGWAGRDGTPIEEAVGRFGDTFVRASLWDASTKRYLHYHPGRESTNPLHELNHGDALWVELAADARWWQSGAGPPPVEFLGEFTDEKRSEILGWVDGTRALIAERWGVEAPFTTYVGDREAVAPTYRRVRGSTNVTTCGNYSNSVIFLVDDCVNGGAHAHEYFHAVQFHLIGKPGKRVPGWMIEGSATYSLILYRGTVSTRQTGDERIQEARRQNEAVLGGYNLLPLSELESYSATVKPGNFGFTLGFLAVARLAEHAGDESIVDFFVRLADERTWRAAFEGAFGLTVDDFYEQFEAYRAATIIPLPHLTDDSDEPALEFVGDVPSSTAEAVRTDFDSLRAFFSDQLRAGTADYTIFAAAEPESVAAAHMRAFGEEPRDGFCDRSSNSGLAVVIDLNCHSTAPRELDGAHFKNVRRTLVPWESRPRMPAGFADYGPFWLDSPAETYVTYVYRTEAGIDGAEGIRNQAVSSAIGLTRSLSSTENGWELGDEYHGARGLGFVALELLAERAGEAALFDYYRLLPHSETWEEAFGGAFSMTVDTFYAVFGEHRVEVWPPFPHETDGQDRPLLVFLGDVPSGTEAAVRAELDAVQRRFRELGAGTADYTVYVGADREALADIYVRVAGRQPPERLCNWQTGQGVALLNLDCLGTAPHSLDAFHLTAVRERLAPAASLPPASSGVDQRGPTWLWQGVSRYMRHLYRVQRGYADLDASRNEASSGAGQTSRLLSTSSTPAGFHEEYWPSGSLAFLALEWLAEHAGQQAIFEYYRLLPDSESWEEAFEAAFGIGVDDFYEAFEAHRALAAPPFPHLVDDRDEPLLVFVGDISPATEAAVRAEIDALEAWFSEQFRTGTADYTLFLGADRDALVDAHRRVMGTEASERFCLRAPYSGAGMVNLDCRHTAPYGLDASHFVGVREQVSPSRSLPATPEGFDRWGPVWLVGSSQAYVLHSYRVARGRAELGASRDRETARATQTTRLLSSTSTLAGYSENSLASRALGLLAVEWLAERAGDTALFEYYRLLPKSRSWEEAFEAAFGIGVDDFYEAFEAYRAEVAPPTP